MTNERPAYRSPYHQIQEQIQDGLTTEIVNDFVGDDLFVNLEGLKDRYEVDTSPLHPETLRALCHYAAVAAGELTNTAVLYRARPSSTGEGYRQKKEYIREFVVVTRAEARPIKRTVTHEPRPPRSSRSSGGGPASLGHHPQSNQVPSHTSRLIGRRDGF